MSCSAIPTLMRRSGNNFWNCTRLLEPTLSLQTATMREFRVCEFDERFGESLTTIERLDLGCCRRGHRASSLRASSTCSGDGTLWCHSTRSSMKETPLPFDRVGDDAARFAGSRSGEGVEERLMVVAVTFDSVPPESAPLVRERIETIGVLRARALLQTVAVDDRGQMCPTGDGRRTSRLPSWSLPEARHRRARRMFASWRLKASTRSRFQPRSEDRGRAARCWLRRPAPSAGSDGRSAPRAAA